MSTPRIYTYKITFEETPYWYWGSHKEEKFGEYYSGSPVTHKWMWKFYTPEIQILEIFPYTDEGWMQAQLTEQRLIRPDLNNPLCLNEACGNICSLSILRGNGKKAHEVKNEEGKSIRAVNMAKATHQKKNEEGKSVNAVKGAKKLHEEKDEQGRSLAAMNIHKEKTEEGKSKHAMENLDIINSQKWMCLESGYVSTSGPLTCWQKARGIDPKNRVQIL